MIFEITELKETAVCWLPSIHRSGYIIYRMVTGLFFTGFLLLFFIHVDISVRANGFIRPYYREGDQVSPGGPLMGECYVLSKDIGLLKTGQAVRLQIDAFNYNYFGVLTGKIYSIDNDFTLLDKTPVFKVRCKLDDRILKLSNGYSGELKKGMGFQARFIICKRSLWQLLYDGMDDWLNPVHQHS
jgi:HlyD family secretion protein